jgi:hypothetical protein
MTFKTEGHSLFHGICLTRVQEHLWSESRHFDALGVLDGKVFGSVWNNGNGGHHELTPRSAPGTDLIVKEFKDRMVSSFGPYVTPGKDVFDFGIDVLLAFHDWAAYVRSCRRFLGAGKCFRMMTQLPSGACHYKFHVWPRNVTLAEFSDEASKLGFVWDSPQVVGYENLCLDVNSFAPEVGQVPSGNKSSKGLVQQKTIQDEFPFSN